MIRTICGCRPRLLVVVAAWSLAAARVMAQVATPDPGASPKDGKHPRFVVRASPEVLWPADGRHVEVTISVVATDGNGASPRLRLAAITCNQKLEIGVDVREATFGTDDRVFLLRATSSLTTRDRIYRVIYEVVDAAGNRSRATARVVVPRHVPATPASRGWRRAPTSLFHPAAPLARGAAAPGGAEATSGLPWPH